MPIPTYAHTVFHLVAPKCLSCSGINLLVYAYTYCDGPLADADVGQFILKPLSADTSDVQKLLCIPNIHKLMPNAHRSEVKVTLRINTIIVGGWYTL